MKNILIINICILLLFSCGKSNKIKRDLKMLQSKSITIPTNIEILINSKNPSIENFMDSELKLIIYTDSFSCSTCEIDKLFYGIII